MSVPSYHLHVRENLVVGSKCQVVVDEDARLLHARYVEFFSGLAHDLSLLLTDSKFLQTSLRRASAGWRDAAGWQI